MSVRYLPFVSLTPAQLHTRQTVDRAGREPVHAEEEAGGCGEADRAAGKGEQGPARRGTDRSRTAPTTAMLKLLM